MAAESRVTLILLLCLVATAAGCSLWSAPKPVQAPLTKEQAEWWAANQDRKRFVPGRGYYVEGTSGFFDHEGRKVADNVGPASASDDQSLLEKMAPKHAIARMKKAVGRGPNEQIARKSLEEGDTHFRKKEYAKAAAKYRAAYKRWPDSPLEEEAIFKAAESQFFADRYSKADDEYSLLIKKYPSTQYLSQAVPRRFAIGRYWEQFDRVHPHWPVTPNLVDNTRPLFDTGGHALRVYERIRLDDPTGPLADDAVMATANTHFLKGHWEEADYNYGLLRSEFPKSEHQFQAHLLGLRCKLLRYQGASYDGSPLDEAEDLASQLLTQFSHELGAERERVAQVRASVRDQRALRDFDLAEYYAKGKYYAASRIYYTKVAEKFPETKLAQESRSRLEQFRSEPDRPTPPLQWLVDLVPQSKREGPVLPKNFAASATTVATNPGSNATR
jgi:outer membrane protein assembly factor BamD (BamD/ComL family)